MKLFHAEIEADIVEYKGYFYFSLSQFNAIFRMNIENERTECISFLKGKKVEQAYRDAFRYHEFAWFIPWQAREILCLNMENLSTEYYSIPGLQENETKININPTPYFTTSLRIDNEKIILVPTMANNVILIDMRTKEINVYPDIPILRTQKMVGGTLASEYLYMSPYDGSNMIALNYLTLEVKYYPWKEKCAACNNMTYYDNRLWWSPGTADYLLTFDLLEEKYKKIPMGDIFNSQYSYFDIFTYKKEIVLLPWRSNVFLIYNPQTNEWRIREKDKEVCWNYATEIRKIHSDNGIIMASSRTGYIMVYNENMNEFHNIPVMIDVEDVRKRAVKDLDIICETFNNVDYLNADMYIGLDNYLKLCLEM